VSGYDSDKAIQPETKAAIEAEVIRARTKFPPSKKQTAALMDALVEEVGELAKARLEHGPKSEQAHVEASHVACVAIRMMEEMGYGEIPLMFATPAKTCGTLDDDAQASDIHGGGW